MVEDGVGVTLDKVWEPPLPAAVGLEEASRVVFLHQLLFQAQGTLIPPGVVGLAGGPLQLTAGPHVLAAAPLCPALPMWRGMATRLPRGFWKPTGEMSAAVQASATNRQR